MKPTLVFTLREYIFWLRMRNFFYALMSYDWGMWCVGDRAVLLAMENPTLVNFPAFIQAAAPKSGRKQFVSRLVATKSVLPDTAIQMGMLSPLVIKLALIAAPLPLHSLTVLECGGHRRSMPNDSATTAPGVATPTSLLATQTQDASSRKF
jgi:hypothetical protein